MLSYIILNIFYKLLNLNYKLAKYLVLYLYVCCFLYVFIH